MSDTIPNLRLLTIEEAQQVLRLSPRGFAALRARGDGPPETQIGGRVLFRADQLQLWLDQRTPHLLEGDEREEGDEVIPAPNHATAAYRARIAARKAKADRDRAERNQVTRLREQQRRAGGGATGPELRPLAVAENEDEGLRARRAEMASRG